MAMRTTDPCRRGRLGVCRKVDLGREGESGASRVAGGVEDGLNQREESADGRRVADPRHGRRTGV